MVSTKWLVGRAPSCVLLLSVIVASCGGSSGGSAPAEPAGAIPGDAMEVVADSPIAQPGTGLDTPADPNIEAGESDAQSEMDPTPSSDNGQIGEFAAETDGASIEDPTAENPTETTENGAMQPVELDDDASSVVSTNNDPSPESPDVGDAGATEAEQDSVVLLALRDDPAPGIPSFTFNSVEQISTHPSGRAAILGAYSERFQISRNAIWMLENGGLRLALDDTTEIIGLLPGRTLSRLSGVSVASDGSAVTLMSTNVESGDAFSGPDRGESNLLLISDAGVEVLHTTGEMLSDETYTQPIQSIPRFSHSANGTAFVAQAGAQLRTGALWAQDEMGTWLVATAEFNEFDFEIIVDACEVHYNNGPIQMLDSGEVVFSAKINSPGVGSDCASNGVGYFKASRAGVVPLVRTGDLVPGDPAFAFGNPILKNLHPNGSLHITTELSDFRSLPFGERRSDRVSHWFIPLTGDPQLILLEGETIEREDGAYVVDLTNIEPSDEFAIYLELNVNDIGSAAAFLRTSISSEGFGSRFSVLGGDAHPTQPYESMLAPASSVLVQLTSTFFRPELPGSQYPLPFTEDDQISEFHLPVVTKNQEAIFFVDIKSAQTGLRKGTYLVRQHFDQSVDVLISPTDRVDNNGRDVLIMNNLLSPNFVFIPSETVPQIEVFDDGSMLVNEGPGLLFISINR